MKKILLLTIIFSLVLFINLFAEDKYKTYTQIFPWIGPEGEEPEVIFYDLISQEKLESVAYKNPDGLIILFSFIDHCWINSIGKIRNDCEYVIRVFRNVPSAKKEYIGHVQPYRDTTTIIVNVNGGGDYTTIQEGINASINGDTVLVYPGTYYENVNFNGKNITLASLELTTNDESYVDSTVIDGNKNGSCIRLDTYENYATIQGFSITKGYEQANYGFEEEGLRFIIVTIF